MRIKYKMNEIYYYLFLIFIMLYYAFRKSTMDYTVFSFSMYLSIPFIILKVLSEKYTSKEALIILGLSTLGCITAITTRDSSVLVAFCIVMGMKNINYKSALKIVFWMRLGTTILLMRLSSLNVIENRIIYRDGSDIAIRNAMGYNHPNGFGIYCFVLISLWFILYVDSQKPNIIKIAIVIILNVFQYRMTNSRAAFLMLLLWTVLVLALYYFKDVRYYQKVARYCMIGGLIISFVIPLLYRSGGWMQGVNRLLNSRISLSQSYIRVYGTSFFGQHIGMNTTSGSYWFLDSGYLNLFLKFGIITGVIFLLLYLNVCKQKIFNSYVYISMTIFAFYALVEDVLASFLVDYLWIVMGAALYMSLDSRQRKISVSNQ